MRQVTKVSSSTAFLLLLKLTRTKRYMGVAKVAKVEEKLVDDRVKK